MPKFAGVVGYQCEIEEKPGVWVSRFAERPVRGDKMQKNYRWQAQQFSTVSSDINSETISIGADDFILQMAEEGKMRYIRYKIGGPRYEIISARPDRPRIVLTIGGLFNG